MTSEFPFMVGYELEGKYKNIKTIFITGIHDIDIILNKVMEFPEIFHIYFDPSGSFHLFDTTILELFSHYIITLELSYNELQYLPEVLPDNVHIMIKYPGNGLTKLRNSNITIKLEDPDNAIYCMPIECFITNDYSNYSSDVKV